MRLTQLFSVTIALAWVTITPYSMAQNPLAQHTQVEVGLGIATPFLMSGSELNRSANLRNNEQGYFQGADGSRKKVGSYSRLIGWSVNTAFYKPISRVKGLLLGSAVRVSLTGTQPSSGGYAEGFYFNYISFGPALKYYPLTNTNLFIKADGGLGSVFTKNRFINDQGQQNFYHQFGIGVNASAGLGYSFLPFQNKKTSLDIQAIYQQFSTRVEVNGVGNDQWTFGALNMSATIAF